MGLLKSKHLREYRIQMNQRPRRKFHRSQECPLVLYNNNIKYRIQMQKTLILAIAALIGTVSSRYSTGQCTTPALQDAFDATKYTGAWFQVAKDRSSPFENGNCEQARYSINADGTLKVFNTQFSNETQSIENATGTAWCNGPQCAVKFFWFSPSADYRVMYTDYENIALVYACNDLFLAKADFVWILSREQNPSQEYVDKALSILAERVPEFTTDNLSWTYQGGACQYFSGPW